jgi:prolipoprotein diacylglyceryltransferase
MLNGVERYWIEKIRVNARYDNFFGFQPTQAEIIAVVFFLVGALGYWVLRRRGNTA